MKKLLLFLLLLPALAFGQATGYVLSNFTTSGSIGTAATTVDVYSRININQTTPGITLSIPNPTNTTTKVTEVWIGNIGTVPFTLNHGGVIDTASMVILKWTGSNYIVTGNKINTSGLLPLPPSDSSYYGMFNGQWTVLDLAPVPVVLDAPVLSMTSTNESIELDWSSVADATNYILQRSTASDFSINLVTVYSGALLTFTDNINTNTDYYYRARATATGYTASAWSNVENAFYNKTIFSNVITDVGTTPTTSLITIGKNKTALQIITGDNSAQLTSRKWRDIEYDFYVQVNSGTVKKIHSYYMNKFLIKCSEGDVIKISSNVARQFCVAQINHSLTLAVPSGFTGTMVTDKASTYFFNATSFHLQLPVDNSVFKITATGTRTPIFIREYDGTTWSGIYHYILEAARDLTIFCGARLISVGTFDGQSLSITAPAGSSLSGTSQETRFSIPAVTGTTYNVTAGDEADLRAKIALAVSGDCISIPAGTYALTVAVDGTYFTANIAAGNKGAAGIQIKGATGVSTDVQIIPIAPLEIDNSTDTKATWIYDLNIDCTSGGQLRCKSGVFRVKNVNGGGVYAADAGIGDADQIGVVMNNSGDVSDCQFFDCNFANASGDIWNFYGNASYPANTAKNNYFVVNCSGQVAGNFQNSQCLTTHQGADVCILGGLFQDSYLDVIANELGTSSYSFLFFTKTRKGARKAGVNQSSLYGCDIESTEGISIGVPGGIADLNYVVHSSTNQLSVCRGQLNINNNYFKKGNTLGSVRCFYNNTNISGDLAIGNIIEGFVNSGQAIYFTGFPVGSTASLKVCNNTFVGCADAIYAPEPLAYIRIGNNAMKGNTNSISGVPASPNNNHAISTGYNILDPTLDADFVTATGDVTGADAALDSNFIPIVGGNADRYTDNSTLGYIGDRDPWGLLKIRDTQYTPCGARCVQRYNADALLIPEAY